MCLTSKMVHLHLLNALKFFQLTLDQYLATSTVHPLNLERDFLGTWLTLDRFGWVFRYSCLSPLLGMFPRRMGIGAHTSSSSVSASHSSIAGLVKMKPAVLLLFSRANYSPLLEKNNRRDCTVHHTQQQASPKSSIEDSCMHFQGETGTVSCTSMVYYFYEQLERYF